MSENNQKKIAVCGGGLVGCLAASYFAKRNFDVELYEYRDDIRKMKVVVGKSINMAISVRGREGLKGIGCEELITSRGIEMHSRMLHDTKGNMTAVPYGRKGQSILSIDRRYINELLLTEAEKHKNVKVFFNHKLNSCNTTEGDIHFQNSKTKEEVHTKCDLIVGCDGAHSIVRQCLLKDRPIDYSQHFISSYYLELRMPPTKDNQFALPINYLHIWPRGDFMLIALPNQDKSFTCTLFMPFELFDGIKNESDVLKFFEKYFPDSIELFGKKELVESYFSTKPSPLLTIKCSSHHSKKCLLLGDSAHAMVPFYGQGMNCGFEDCIVFFELLDQMGFNNLDNLLNAYSNMRVPDAHAICDLAINNYAEMRYIVTTKAYKMRKTLDNILYSLFPSSWIPLYTMVTFSRLRYSKIVEKREKQDKILKNAFITTSVLIAASLIFAAKKANIDFSKALQYVKH